MNSLRVHFISRKPPSTNTDATPLRSPTSFHPPRLDEIVFQHGRLCPLNIAEIDAAFRPQSLPVSAGFNSPPDKPLFIHPAFHAHVFIFQGLLRADSGIPHGKTSPLYLPFPVKKRRSSKQTKRQNENYSRSVRIRWRPDCNAGAETFGEGSKTRINPSFFKSGSSIRKSTVPSPGAQWSSSKPRTS